jgi:hypothetical protein
VQMSERISPAHTHGRRPTTTLRLDPGLRDRIRDLKRELHFHSYDGLLNYIILEVKSESAIPPGDYERIFKSTGTTPCIVTGESGAGKTSMVKELLEQHIGNTFIVDVSDEYGKFKKVDLGQFFNIPWRKSDQRLRFVTSRDEEISKIEGTNIFRQLVFLMHREELKSWCFIIEEGHRFSEDKALRTFVEEARKFTAKVILVCTDWQIYKGIAPIYKPFPHES